MNIIKKGTMLWGMLVCGLGMPTVAWGAEPADSIVGTSINEPDSTALYRDLPEVEIKGAREINKGNMTEIYLSQANRDFGNNAVNAISSLNRFISSLDDSKLTSYDQRPVFVVINGVPSSAEILKSYQASEIKYIKYYETAPAKYRNFTSGPVVDVIIRRVKDYMLAGNFEGSSYITRNANLGGTLTYADSLNRVRAEYMWQEDFDSHGKSRSIIDYGIGNITSISGDRRKLRQHAQRADIAWQRNQGAHLLNADLKYTWYRVSLDAPAGITVTEAGQEHKGSRSQKINGRNHDVVLDLYYGYDFSETSKLALNVVNNYTHTNRRNDLSSDYPSPWDYLDYDVATHYSNDAYSLASQLYYTWKMRAVTMSANATYDYATLRQKSLLTPDRWDSRQNTGRLYVDAEWRKGLLYLMPKLGMQVYNSYSNHESQTTVTPEATLIARMSLNGRLEGAYVQALGQYDTSPIPPGHMNETYTYIDRYFISTGNPALIPSKNWTGQLKVGYFSPNGKVYGTLLGQYFYSRDYCAPMLHREGDMVVKTYGMSPERHFISSELSLGWQMLPSLRLQGYMQAGHEKYATDYRRVSDSFLLGYVSLMWNKGGWYIWASYKSGYTNNNGDAESETPSSVGLTVMWQYKGFSVMAQMMHYSKVKTTQMCEDFRYVDYTNYAPNQRWTAGVRLTYNFSHGWSRRRSEKAISTQIRDLGIE